MKLFNQLVAEQTNFNALLTLEGMIAGYFTSPFIKQYGFTAIIHVIKNAIKDEEWVRNANDEVSAQKRAVNKARNAVGVKEVGSYNFDGYRVPLVEQRPITVDDVKAYR